MTRLLAATVLVGAGAALCWADSPAPPATNAPSVELVLPAGDRPARVGLFVEVDSRPVAAARGAAFGRLLTFCDANGDGRVTRDELVAASWWRRPSTPARPGRRA